jgi:uncharacterized protein
MAEITSGKRGRLQHTDDPAFFKKKIALADGGEAGAQYLLGRMYGAGKGVVKDYSEAFKWLKQSADQCHPEAMFYLGSMYEYGNLVDQSDEVAEQWYLKSADLNVAIASFHLAEMYDQGRGNVLPNREPLNWYREAAENGHSKSQKIVGLHYYNNRLFDLRNVEIAFDWFRKAADQGDYMAQSQLAYMYSVGLGVELNDVEAAYWCHKSAQHGDSQSQYDLANLYANGFGVSQNYTEAAKWYRVAAKSGHSDAQLHLGKLYYAGMGVTKSYKYAAKWFRLAADQGEKDAIVQLGLMQLFGLGGVEEDIETEEQIEKLAVEGHAYAQVIFAASMLSESENHGNYDESLKWLHRSAEQGNKLAQFCLGYLHKEGDGVPFDEVKAYVWLTLSNCSKDELIEEQTSELAENMSSGQVTEAQKLLVNGQRKIH